MKTNNPIYTTTETPVEAESGKIKQYKFDSLHYHSKSFKNIWKTGTFPGATTLQTAYKLGTTLSLAHFTVPEIIRMLVSWSKTHGHQMSPGKLSVIANEVADFTKDEKRRNKRESMQRYRDKKRAEKRAAKLAGGAR